MLPDAPNPEKESEKSWVKDLGLLTVITAELLGFTGAGVGLGYWLWKKHGLPWWVLLLCTMAGLVVAFIRIYDISKRESND